MKYIIPVWWSMCGEYEIEANSLDEAVKIVNDGEISPCDDLPEGYYIDDSLAINEGCLEELRRLEEEKNEHGN